MLSAPSLATVCPPRQATLPFVPHQLPDAGGLLCGINEGQGQLCLCVYGASRRHALTNTACVGASAMAKRGPPRTAHEGAPMQPPRVETTAGDTEGLGVAQGSAKRRRRGERGGAAGAEDGPPQLPSSAKDAFAAGALHVTPTTGTWGSENVIVPPKVVQPGSRGAEAAVGGVQRARQQQLHERVLAPLLDAQQQQREQQQQQREQQQEQREQQQEQPGQPGQAPQPLLHERVLTPLVDSQQQAQHETQSGSLPSTPAVTGSFLQLLGLNQASLARVKQWRPSATAVQNVAFQEVDSVVGAEADAGTHDTGSRAPSRRASHAALLLDAPSLQQQPAAPAGPSRPSLEEEDIPQASDVDALPMSPASQATTNDFVWEDDSELDPRHPRWAVPRFFHRYFESKMGDAPRLHRWQASCLEQQARGGGNLVFTAPTSGGKSVVGDILLLRAVSATNRAALVVLPFVSLVNEKVEEYERLFRGTGRGVKAYHGAVGRGPPERGTAVCVATIEKANGLVNELALDNTLVETFCIVIVDELHYVADASRGHLCELLLAKMLYLGGSRRPTSNGLPPPPLPAGNANADAGAQAPAVARSLPAGSKRAPADILIVGMSATLPGARAVHRWFGGTLFRATDADRPVPLEEWLAVYTHGGEAGAPAPDNAFAAAVAANKAHLGHMDENSIDIIWATSGVSKRRLSTPKPSAMLDAEASAAVALVEETLRQGGAALLFCPTKAMCWQLALRLANALKHACPAWLEPISVKARKARTAALDELQLADRSELPGAHKKGALKGLECPQNDVLGYCIGKGIAWHNAALSSDERKAVERVYRGAGVRVLCATTTLAAGVNLPARRVLVMGLRAGRDEHDPTTIRQMCGRAGRVGFDDRGEAFVVVPASLRERAAELMAAARAQGDEAAEGGGIIRSCFARPCEGVRPHAADRVGSGATALRRAVMEAVVGGYVATAEEIATYLGCTLLAATGGGTATGSVASDAAVDALRWCQRMRLIAYDQTAQRWVACARGLAATRAPIMAPEVILAAIDDARLILQKGYAGGAGSALAMCWAAVPEDTASAHAAAWKSTQWHHLHQALQHQLTRQESIVAAALGVDDKFLRDAARPTARGKGVGTAADEGTDFPSGSARAGVKLFMALALQPLADGADTKSVAAMMEHKVENAMPDLDALREAAGLRAASLAAVFEQLSQDPAECKRLGVSAAELDGYSAYLSKLAPRVSAGGGEEVRALCEIPGVKPARAKLLFKAGLSDVERVARAGAERVSKAIAGGAPGAAQKRAIKSLATRIVRAAGKVWESHSSRQAAHIEHARICAQAARHALCCEVGAYDGGLEGFARAWATVSDFGIEAHLEDSRSAARAQGAPRKVLAGIAVAFALPRASVVDDDSDGPSTQAGHATESVIKVYVGLRVDEAAGVTAAMVARRWTVIRKALAKLKSKDAQQGVTRTCAVWGLRAQLTALEHGVGGEALQLPDNLCGMHEVLLVECLLAGGQCPEGALTPNQVLEDYAQQASAASGGEQTALQGMAKAVAVSGCELLGIVSEPRRLCCERAALALALLPHQRKWLHSDTAQGLASALARIELPLLRVLSGMQEAGVGFDAPAARRCIMAARSRTRQVEATMFELFGERKVEWTSAAKLSEALFEGKPLRLPKPDGAPTLRSGQVSTRCEVLAELAGNPVVEAVLEARELHRLATSVVSYLECAASTTRLSALPSGADSEEALGVIQRIHTTWLQCGAATGRVVSDGPNLQCVQKHRSNANGRAVVSRGVGGAAARHEGYPAARACFVAGAEDRVLVSVDYREAELRLLADMASDDVLCSALARSEDVFGRLGAAAGCSRDDAKRLVYMKIYSLGAVGKASASFERAFAEGFGASLRWLKAQAERAARPGGSGFVSTLGGRLRKLAIGAGAPTDRARQLASALVQGSLADILKRAAVIAMRQLADLPLSSDSGGRSSPARLVLLVHDELVAECAAADALAAAKVLSTAMCTAAQELGATRVPMETKARAGRSWGALEPLEGWAFGA